MAAELGVAYEFRVVKDLRSLEAGDYGGNPALRMPILKSPRGEWFGSLPISRELARLAPEPRQIVWPEDLSLALPSILLVLTSQGMSRYV
jgi:hypothetical protein